MTDAELIEGLESATLTAGQFTHVAHVRAAWVCLRQAPLAEALGRYSGMVRGFAAAKGVPWKYHETMTVAYMLVIAERLADAADASWDEFAAANPDLLSHAPSVLASYYSDGVLGSERARRGFVMPDRLLPPARSLEA